MVKTARILARLGELPPINLDGETKFRHILEKFPEPLKSKVDAFRLEISSRHMKSASSVKIIRAITRYYQFLPETKNFWMSEVKTAQDFLDQLPSAGVCDYSEHLNSLKRFFNWGMSRDFTASNPFLEIAPKRLIRICANCKKEKIFRIHDTLSAECDIDRRYCAKIEVQKSKFVPKSAYNQIIYDLYLKYINRFMLQPKHYQATLKLQKFLSETDVVPFTSWTQVTLLSREFKRTHGETPGGCPIEKIGRMLQELSVLSIREEDPEIYLLREISDWEPRDRGLAKRYAGVLMKH